jgi:hypothetical protein
MHITLIPQRSEARLSLSRAGSVLIIDGVAYDFAPLPEGATLPRAAVDCPALAGDVTRTGGVLQIALILPHGANPPMEARFPEPITVAEDGPITLPAPNLPDEVTE